MRKALFLRFSPGFFRGLFPGLFLALFVQLATIPIANAKGPYGNIHVSNWRGGAFTDDNAGAFSHCAARWPTATASF